MAVTKIPNVGLPTSAQTVRKNFTPGTGETIDYEYTGTSDECAGKYNVWKQQSQLGGFPGNNIRSITLDQTQGRGRVMAQFTRNDGGSNSISGTPPDVAIVEELIAVDIVRDVFAAGYFVTGGAMAVTDDQAVIVRKAVRLSLTEANITLASCGLAWASWTDGMKQLRYHLAHGQESYYETGFVLRRSKHGVITSQIKEAMSNINTVVTAPTFASEMDKLIESLPAGEWLYRPPQAEYIGDGKWRVTQEWHWAVKWSKMYGGTWGL